MSGEGVIEIQSGPVIIHNGWKSFVLSDGHHPLRIAPQMAVDGIMLGVPRLKGKSQTMRLRFGEFEFDNRTGELWEGTTEIRLQPQPARVLALLTAQPGELLARETLQQHVWDRGTIVDFEQGAT